MKIILQAYTIILSASGGNPLKKIILAIPFVAVAIAGGGYYYNQQQAPHRPVMQECLGRLTFEVPAGLHWGLANPVVPMSFRPRVSNRSIKEYDTWEYNKNLLVMVSPETEKINFDEQWMRFKAFDYHIREADKEIEQIKRLLANTIKAQQKQKIRLANGETILDTMLITDKSIKEWEDELVKAQQARAKLDEPVPIHQLGIPDAYSVSSDVQWANAWRQNRVYLFRFSNRLKDKYNSVTDAFPLSEVKETLKRFHPRRLGEIPQSPAFCFPYGSISDNGNVGYEIKNSFYFEDQPNVIYSIYTGTYRVKPSSNVANQGLREPIINYGKQTKDYEHQPISETFNLGSGEKITLTGQLSTLKSSIKNGEPYDYVLTGETDGTAPFIGIQVIAVNQDAEDGRPNHAPPLAQTLKRLKPILNSMQVTLDKPPSQ